MRPHFVDGVLPGLDPHVGEDAVLGVKELAEALKKQHVRGQLALVLMLYAEEHVVVGFAGVSCVDGALRLVEVDPGVPEVVLLHPHRVQDGLV